MYKQAKHVQFQNREEVEKNHDVFRASCEGISNGHCCIDHSGDMFVSDNQVKKRG